MSITFLIAGRSIDPDAFGQGGTADAKVLRAMKRDLEAKLQGVIDPATGRAPDITVTGESVADVTIASSGAKAVVDDVKRRLGLR